MHMKHMHYKQGIAAPLLVALVLSIIGGAVYFESQYNVAGLDIMNRRVVTNTNSLPENESVQLENTSQNIQEVSDSESPAASVSPIASLDITYPNGGETWYTGDIVPITWDSENIPSDATINFYLTDIDLQKYGAPNETIGYLLGSTKNTGSTKVFVPRFGMPSGLWYNFAKLRIEWGAQTAVQDKTDTAIRLETPSTNLVHMEHDVTAPIDGSVYALGDVITVRWDKDSYHEAGQEWFNFLPAEGAIISLVSAPPCSQHGWFLARTDNDGIRSLELIPDETDTRTVVSVLAKPECQQYQIRVTFDNGQVSSEGKSGVFTLTEQVK